MVEETMTTSKEIGKKVEGAMVDFSGYEEYAGAGFENQTSEDYSLPFLQILQALSPQVLEDDSMRPGQIFNTVTGEIWDGKTGIVFVPATTAHQYVEWVPREKGGGFAGLHEIDDPVVHEAKARATEFGQLKLENGNALVETKYVYGIALDDEGNSMEAVLAFTSTKIKKYNNWMTKAKTMQWKLPDGRRMIPPLFAHRYRLTTVQEKNNKGSYFNWDIKFDGPNAASCVLTPDNDLFQAAAAIRKMLAEGNARANYESQTAGSGNDIEGAPGKPVF